MCFSIPLKIKQINNDRAEMEDGRVVKLGKLNNLKAGDFLEVYADLAVQKLDKMQALDIRKLIKKSK